MVLRYVECANCGTQYYFQASGSYDAIDTPHEFQDERYCPECKEAIVKALKTIPRKFEYRSVPTTEVTLEQLEQWEKELAETITRNNGLHSRKVFVGLYRKGEAEVIREVIGCGEHEGRVYIYRYWPSEKENYKITVEKRFDIQKNEDVGYKIDRVRRWW